MASLSLSFPLPSVPVTHALVATLRQLREAAQAMIVSCFLCSVFLLRLSLPPRPQTGEQQLLEAALAMMPSASEDIRRPIDDIRRGKPSPPASPPASFPPADSSYASRPRPGGGSFGECEGRMCSLQNVFSAECVLCSVFSTECVLYRMRSL